MAADETITATQPRAERPAVPRLLVWILAGHALFAVAYTFLIPLDRGPDEPHHFAYIQHLDRYHALPQLSSPTVTRDMRDMAIAIHPPLYYLCCLPVYELVKGLPDPFVRHLFRLFAVLMGTLTVFMSYRIAELLFPARPSLCLSVAAFVAFLPEYQLVSSVINNDGLTTLLATLFLYALLQALRRPPHPSLWSKVGVHCGLIVLTKASGAALLPGGLVAWLYSALRQHIGVAKSLLSAVLYSTIPVAMSAWWFLNLKHRVGRFSPIPHLYDNTPLVLHHWTGLFTIDGMFLIHRFLIGSEQSVWGQIDWFRPLPQYPAAAFFRFSWPMYWLLTALLIVSLAGIVRGLLRFSQRGEALNDTTAGLLVLGTQFGLLYAALAQYTLFVHPGGYEGGRYLMPVISAFGIFFCLGIETWMPEAWRRWMPAAILVIFVAFNLLCIGNLVGFLNPFYAPGVGIAYPLY